MAMRAPKSPPALSPLKHGQPKTLVVARTTKATVTCILLRARIDLAGKRIDLGFGFVSFRMFCRVLGLVRSIVGVARERSKSALLPAGTVQIPPIPIPCCLSLPFVGGRQKVQTV